MTQKSTIAREWRTKYPDMPTHQLSRIIYKAKGNNTIFKDVENVRSTLRRIEGKQGSAMLKKLSDKSLVLTEARNINPYNLPETHKKEWPFYYIKGKMGLIMNDIHIPYHDNDVITLAIKEAKRRKVDFIFINGDLLDAFSLSKYDKDPRKRKFSEELDDAKMFFAALRKAFPLATIHYKLGNHEERYENYMYRKCRELIGVDDFRLEALLDCDKYGVNVIAEKRVVRLNGLSALHGHEFPTGIAAPVNTARGLFLRSKASAIQGHTHSSSEHTEPNINGDIITCWSVGCMCELHPEYMPINKWNHGFAFISLDDDGIGYHVDNVRVYEGRML